jgi:putative endonuclease
MTWFCYVLECADRSLYTGITTDIDRRVREHNTDNLKGAKSLRGKRPVKLVHLETYNTESEARIREAAIKHWKREYKLKLINSKSNQGLP